MSDYAGGNPLQYVGTSVCGRWEGPSAAGAGIVFERGADGRYSKSYDNALFCDNPQYSLTVTRDCNVSITVWDVVRAPACSTRARSARADARRMCAPHGRSGGGGAA